MTYIIIVAIVLIAVSIAIVVNDKKYPLYTDKTDGVGYSYIGEANPCEKKVHILRSTKDSSFILVLDEEFKERFVS